MEKVSWDWNSNSQKVAPVKELVGQNFAGPKFPTTPAYWFESANDNPQPWFPPKSADGTMAELRVMRRMMKIIVTLHIFCVFKHQTSHDDNNWNDVAFVGTCSGQWGTFVLSLGLSDGALDGDEILVLRNHAKGVLPGEDNNFDGVEPFNCSYCTSWVKSMDGALHHRAQHMNGHHQTWFWVVPSKTFEWLGSCEFLEMHFRGHNWLVGTFPINFPLVSFPSHPPCIRYLIWFV